jgi:ribosomal protein L7Ae-like RNA K-turn-binding protein
MASVRKSKRNVTGEKALGSGHSGGVPTMGGAPSVTGGQTSNWAKVVSRGKGGARSSPGVPCNADGNSEGLRTAAKTKEHSKRSKPDKYFAKQKLKKKEDNSLFAHLVIASKNARQNKKKGKTRESNRQSNNGGGSGSSQYRKKAPERSKKSVVIVTKQELEYTQKVVRGETVGSDKDAVVQRKKKKKRPTRLKKAIVKDRKARWLNANPILTLAERTCFDGNLYNAVARALDLKMLVPSWEELSVSRRTKLETKILDSVRPREKTGFEQVAQSDGTSEKADAKGKKSKFVSPYPKVPNSLYIREYVHQIVDKELDGKVSLLLKNLNHFQEKMRKSDPQRAALRRRLVFGTREVLKATRTKKAKCVIVATNIDEGSAAGGLDDVVSKILKNAESNAIPVIFALRRRTLGRALGKSLKMSAVAIYNADDASGTYKEVLQMAAECKKRWEILQHLNPQATCFVPPDGASNQNLDSKEKVRDSLSTKSGSAHENPAAPYVANVDKIKVPLVVFNPSAAEWTPGV